MLRSRVLSQFLVLPFLVLLLQACGDDSDRADTPITDFENYRELHLTSLEVTVGGQVAELVPSFSRDFVGPYTLEVAADVDSISLKPTLFDDSNLMEIAKNEIVYENGEPKKDANGNFVLTSLGENKLVASGEVDTKTLREGDNNIVIRISPPDSNVFLVYKIFVHRPSTTAQLLDIRLRDTGYEGTGSDLLQLTPEFDPVVSSYTASTPYHACTIETFVRTPERHTAVTVNGEAIEHLTLLPFDLDVGENTFNYISTPEFGAGEQQYTITVTRSAPTDSDLADDATLANLELVGGEFTRDFKCLLRTHTGLVNNNTPDVQIIATPVVEGAVLTLGDPGRDINGNIVFNASGNVTTILNGEEIPGGEPVEIALDVGTITKVVRVVSTSGSITRDYLLSLTRLSTNRVLVETPQELQLALQNAQPNDEILLTSESYSGVASEETSGHAEAHFYAAASGTLEEPIIVRSGISGFKPALVGDVNASNSVLRIEGDYWVVQNIEIKDGQTGILLDSANHNTLSGVLVNDVNERGIHIRNGSSYNIVQRSVIVDTGLNPGAGSEDHAEAIVIGSAADDWSSAPEGAFDEKDYDNIIANNLIGTDVRAEAIDVKEGTLRTQIRHNIIDLKGISNLAENGSAIVVKGNQVDIAYNSFFNDAGTGLQQLITLQNVQRDWLTLPWGEDARVFQNVASLGGADIPFVNSTDVINTDVADNQRSDGGAVTYVGTGVNESFTTPKIVIKTNSDPARCLADVEVEGSEAGQLRVVECNSNSEQQWQLINDENGYVFITKNGAGTQVMRPEYSDYVNQRSTATVRVGDFPEGATGEGFVFRWQVFYSQKGVSFANKGYSARTVLYSGANVLDGAVLLISAGGNSSEYFTVEEI